MGRSSQAESLATGVLSMNELHMNAVTPSGIALSAATLLVIAAPFQASATAVSTNLGVSAVVSASCLISAVSVARGHLTGLTTAPNGAWAVTTACTDGTNAVVTLGRVGASGTSLLRTIANGPNGLARVLPLSIGRRTFVWDKAGAVLAAETGPTTRSPAGGAPTATSVPTESNQNVMVATVTL
jgi:spore coat protein U-like protein